MVIKRTITIIETEKHVIRDSFLARTILLIERHSTVTQPNAVF